MFRRIVQTRLLTAAILCCGSAIQAQTHPEVHNLLKGYKDEAQQQLSKGQSLPAPQIMTSLQGKTESVVFSEDFESSTANWSYQGTLWQIGQPTSGPGFAHSGSRCAATNLHGNYPDNAAAGLVSHSIALPSLPQPRSSIILRYWQWYVTESGYDHARVWVSTDNGQNWTNLRSFDGTADFWHEATLDLTAYAGQSIRLDFYLTSDGSINYSGWYVDDISVEVIEPLATSRLEIAVGPNGQFTMGIPAGPMLLFGHPDPWSSATTIQVDGEDYWNFNRNAWTTLISPPTTTGLSNSATWQVSANIQVKQTLTIVQGSTTGDYDTGEIRYTVTNADATAHQVGIRVMLDTMLGLNDGAPFRVPGAGAVTTDREWNSSSMPPYFQAFDDLDNPTVQSQGTLVGGNAVRPDRFVATGWSRIRDTRWDYFTIPGRDFYTSGYGYDSAVGIYWFPVNLLPGETREFVTYYGLGGIDIDIQPPLVVGLSAPRAIVLLNGESPDNPFTLSVYLSNSSPGVTQTARGVQTRLILPQGLELATGQTATHNLPDMVIGAEQQTEYVIQVPTEAAGEMRYSLFVGAANITSKTVSKETFIFGITASPEPEGAAPSSLAAINASFNVDLDAGSVTEATVQLVASNAQQVPGFVSYDGPTRTVTFSPSAPLQADEVYLVELSTSIRSAHGHNLPHQVIWRFSTTQDFGAALLAKQSLIDHFDSQEFYAAEEARAQSHLNTVKARYEQGVAAEDEMESIVRLGFSEQMANEGLQEAEEIADIATRGATATIDLMFWVVAKTGDLTKRVAKIPFIGRHLARGMERITRGLINVTNSATKIFMVKALDWHPQYFNWGWRYGQLVLPQTSRKTLEYAIDSGFEEAGHWGTEKLDQIFPQIKAWTKRRFFLGLLYEESSNESLDKGVTLALATPPVFNPGESHTAQSLVDLKATEMHATTQQVARYGEAVLGAAEETEALNGWVTIGLIFTAIAAAIVSALAAASTGVGLPAAAFALAAAVGGLVTVSTVLETVVIGSKLTDTALMTGYLMRVLPEYVDQGTDLAFDQPVTAAAELTDVSGHNLNSGLYAQIGNSALNVSSASTLTATLHDETMDYKQSLENLYRIIFSGDAQRTESAVAEVERAGQPYTEEIDIALSEILAAYAVEGRSVAGFDSLYLAPVESNRYRVGFGQVAFEAAIAAFQLQPSESDNVELVQGQIEKLIAAILAQTQAVDEVGRRMAEAGIEIPPLVEIRRVDNPASVERNLAFSISAVVHNLASKPIAAISTQLSFVDTAGVQLSSPVQTIAHLDPNQATTVSWEMVYKGNESLVTGFISLDLPPSNEEFVTLPPRFVPLFVQDETSPSTHGSLERENIYAYPNPFNPELETVAIRYSLRLEGSVSLKIYDVSNHLVRMLSSDRMRRAATEYVETWDGRNEADELVANGVYFYVIESSSGERAVGKVAVLR